ncbi:phosphatase PAP2 family protein [Companilactobacillus halodurans]|uniref:Phosphatase PAP2 family protein n=1 Tax=Companilactobacillus halodurans TaxID=2584183 RepID=A0A5P0ZTD9_9LACO|nr:phosphatase PAP2 family protein [Companilactobacillus halodurans]MQS75600.1 phosphatase PAP2 family protein [Companilactobacillus halodurans]MQS96313.1 phosphatase PAP2 family protein [Companilactobacillus halodurans]
MKIFAKITILNILLLVAFCFWSLNVALKTTLIKNFDMTLIRQIYHANDLTLTFFRQVTNIGDTYQTITIAAIIFIILIIKKYNYAAIFLVLNKVVVAGLNSLIKLIVQRPRPEHHHFVYAGGYSFPSGHSASSFALYISVLIISLFIFKKISIKIIISMIAILLVILVGYSRIFLGVHYPSDVLGGYLLAATILTFNTLLFSMKDFFILQLKGIKN